VFGTSKAKPINSLADFAGRKIRTVAPQETEMLKRLNAASVALTLPEVPVALERGVMDGLISASFNVVGTKWYELLKWVYVSELHIGGPNYELVNMEAYNKLGAKEKAVLDQVAKEWADKMNKTIAARDAADLKDLHDKYGLDLIQAKPEDMKALNAKMQDYWDSWAKDQGPDGVAMMKEIRAKLGR
jgi:TRAP-type C4-dicarboxylate transport system substrate-binding protein